MKNFLTQSTAFLLAAMLSATAWAADEPIGALTVNGKATIAAGDSEFTLTDQEYAYFSGDVIDTAEDSQSVITTNDGLRVAFGQSSSAKITREDGVYTIDLVAGTMAVGAQEDTEYRLTRNGETVSGSEQYVAGDEPYVASVTPDENDVQFYMPAQLGEGGGSLAGMSGAQIAGIIGAVVLGGVAINEVTQDDDEGPSS